MRLKLIFILLFVLSFSKLARADFSKDTTIELNVGYAKEASIENPDSTIAYYDGYGFMARVNLPIYSNRSGMVTSSFSDLGKSFRFAGFIDYKKLYFTNSSDGSTSEKGEHEGPSIGLSLRASFIYLTASYGFIKGQHEANGQLQGNTEFKYNPITYEAGFLLPYGNILEFGLSYSLATADIPKEDTNLSADSPYNENMIWFKLMFYLER